MALRGQTSTGNVIGMAVAIAVFVIVGVGVAIPLVNDVIAQAGLSGLTAMVVGFIPVMLAVAIFVGAVRPIMHSL